MLNIPEQLSAARKNQLEAQIDFFNSVTSKAVANAEKIIALNLNLTRDTVARSTAAMCQALTAREPADLLALTTRAPDTFGSLMAYGRELMAIAASAAPASTSGAAPAAEARSAALKPLAFNLDSKAAGSAPAAQAEPVLEQILEQAAEHSVAPEAEPVIPAANAFEAEASPQVNAKAMAKAVGGALGSGVPKSAAAPTATPDAKVKVNVKPVDAAPPPAPSAGTPEVAQHDPAAAKGKRKK